MTLVWAQVKRLILGRETQILHWARGPMYSMRSPNSTFPLLTLVWAQVKKLLLGQEIQNLHWAHGPMHPIRSPNSTFPNSIQKRRN